MHPIILVCTLLAVLFAGPAVAAPSTDPAPAEPAAVPAASGTACPNVVALESLFAEELEGWMTTAGVEAMSASGGTTGPPRCPKRISCDPCGQGHGPCLLIPFGSENCCISPLGPCFQCPKGEEIFISTCPCFGQLEGDRCPPRDQDWFCA